MVNKLISKPFINGGNVGTVAIPIKLILIKGLAKYPVLKNFMDFSLADNDFKRLMVLLFGPDYLDPLLMFLLLKTLF